MAQTTVCDPGLRLARLGLAHLGRPRLREPQAARAWVALGCAGPRPRAIQAWGSHAWVAATWVALGRARPGTPQAAHNPGLGLTHLGRRGLGLPRSPRPESFSPSDLSL